MFIRNYLSGKYPVAYEFDGVNSVQDMLVNSHFLVVLDDNEKYVGILTSNDLIQRPHKIVADCMTPKPYLNIGEEIISVLKRVDIDQIVALPVFDNHAFCGIIRKADLIQSLIDKIEDLHNKGAINKNIMSLMFENLSHEVRTPLNSIVGFIDLLSNMNEEELNENRGEYYQTIQVNSDRFLLTMNSLIELSQIHSGFNIDVFNEDFNIESIFPRLIEYFSNSIIYKDKKAKIIHIGTDLPLNISADKKKIIHILYHIIDNVFIFDDNIDLTMGCNLLLESAEIEFYISNNRGDDTVNKLIPFYNALDDEKFDHKKYGPPFGVGISLIREYTKMLGGQVYYQAGKGKNTIYLKLPVVGTNRFN
jgi:signal transduction histidine kinase